jgi:hypothetical protein
VNACYQRLIDEPRVAVHANSTRHFHDTGVGRTFPAVAVRSAVSGELADAGGREKGCSGTTSRLNRDLVDHTSSIEFISSVQ